jgi:hypothetical protein
VAQATCPWVHRFSTLLFFIPDLFFRKMADAGAKYAQAEQIINRLRYAVRSQSSVNPIGGAHSFSLLRTLDAVLTES